MIDIKIEKCREEAVLPKYANDGDAGMDLYSCEDILVKPGCSVLVSDEFDLGCLYHSVSSLADEYQSEGFDHS